MGALLPLEIGQAALGVGGGIFGAIQGARNKKRNLGMIETAYNIARGRMAQQQAQTRESQLESLNARGLLTGGAPSTGFARPSNIANVGQPGGAGVLAGVNIMRPGIPYQPGKDYLQDPTAGWQQKQMQEYQNSIAGTAGPANTVAGGEQAQQSKEFMLEQQDLDSQRMMQRAAAEQGGNAQILGGIAAGASNVLSGAMGALQPPPQPLGQFTIPMPAEAGAGNLTQSQGRYGVDPVNAFSSPTSVYNFHIGNQTQAGTGRRTGSNVTQSGFGS